MSEAFDPYRKWLGIPPKDQPPNHYRLLGIAHFEDDPDVIDNAASRQLAHVRTFQAGKHSADSQRILNELTAAQLCLLQPAKKAAYDSALRQQLAASGQLSSDGMLGAEVEEEPEVCPPPPPPPPPDYFRMNAHRWRTGSEIESPSPSVGPAPVPIPMPPVPPTALPIALKTAGPVIRRGASAGGRGRKQSSGPPLALIFGAVGVLVVAILVAVIVAMQPPASATNQGKSKSTSPDKPSDRPPPKSSVASSSSSFPVGKGQRPPRPEHVNPRSTESLNPSPPAQLGEPQDELKQAREALAKRNDSDFKLHISQAEYLIAQKTPANANELKAEEAHLRAADKLLSQFWQAVRDGADQKIPKGERFKFRKHELELVNREGDQLTYKFDGREDVSSIKKLPARVATMIAYRTFGNDDLSGKIAICLFLTIDADAASDQANRRLAIKLLDDIVKAGEENHPVLSRELGKDPKPRPLADDDFTPPMTVGGTPPSNPAAGNATTGSGANPAATKVSLDPAKIKEAREKFERRFRERLVRATEHIELARPLLTELTEAAEGEETAEFKTQLLTQAGELAAQLGDSNGIVQLSEQVSALNGESSVEIQLRLFGRCALVGVSGPKDLLKNAQAASKRAGTEGNLFAAIELAKIAAKAAEKAGLTAEVNSLQARLQELEKARAERK